MREGVVVDLPPPKRFDFHSVVPVVKATLVKRRRTTTFGFLQFATKGRCLSDKLSVSPSVQLIFF